MEGQMDVLFFNVLIFWFLCRGWKSGQGMSVKGMYRSKEVVFRNKKKEGQRKGK